MRINKKDEIISRILFLILVIFQIICLALINSKTRPTGDEWFTYGLSNNADEDTMFMDENWIDRKTNGTGWVDTDLLKQYITVEAGEEFNFSSVLYNQKRDVHPPLYYILVHFFCSLTPNTFHMLQSGVVNLLALVGVNVILWKMGKFFFLTEYARLIPVFVLCVSPSTGKLFGYDRMYGLLAFFCILLTYLQMKLVNDLRNKRILTAIAVVTCLGGLTHYYFYMYLVSAFVVFACIVIWREKKIASLAPTIVAHFIGGITALILYPTAIKHILFGYRGEQIIGSLFANKLEGFITYYRLIDQYCFRDKFLLFILGAFILIVIGLYLKKISIKEQFVVGVLIIGTVVLFYCIISYISYERLWPYISSSFVLIAFLIGIMCSYALWFLPVQIRTVICMIAMFFLLGNSLISDLHSAVDSDEYYSELEEILETQRGRDCIFVYESWNNLYNNKITDMMVFDEVLSIAIEEIELVSLQDKLLYRQTDDDLVVYLWNKDNENVDRQIKYIEGSLDKEAKLLFSTSRFSVFSMN